MQAERQHDAPPSPAGGVPLFASRIQDARLRRGWTQQELADAITTTTSTVSRWERGERCPTLYFQRQLEQVFGLSAHDLGLAPADVTDTALPDAASRPVTPAPLSDEASPLPRPVRRVPLRSARRKQCRLTRHALFLLLLVAGIFAMPGAASAPRPHPASRALSGTLAFESSGAPGVLDALAIRLADLPAPAPGTAYDAWMAGPSGGAETLWLPLGWLTWTQGLTRLTYRDPQHGNLLGSFSRFLITQEGTQISPVQPSSVWVAETSISDTPTPGDPNHYSLLDHLRHLLAADPALVALDIQGGLAFWLARTTEQVLILTKEARQDWQTHRLAALRQQIIRILDYLDGSAYVSPNVPAGTPLLVAPPLARVGLLTLTPQQTPPGYVLHTDLHLEGVARATGATPFQQREAEHLRAQMNAVALALSLVRADALPLVHLTEMQLAAPPSLARLTALAQAATTAWTGEGGTPGVRQIATDIASLARLAWQPA